MRVTLLVSLLMCVPFGTGCSIKISEQEARLRYTADSDSLEMLLVYKGVVVEYGGKTKEDKQEEVKKAVTIAKKFLAGARIFGFLGWPFVADLDDLEKDLLAEKDNGLSPKERAEALALVRSVRIEQFGGFSDEHGRLSGFQLIRIERFSRVVEFFNRQLSRAVLDSIKNERFAEETPDFDDHTRDLWKAHADEGKPWLKLNGNGIGLDVPMTTESFRRIKMHMIDSLIGDNGGVLVSALLGQLLAHQSEMRLRDERLVLDLEPVEGIFFFAFHNPSAVYTTDLADALQAEGVALSADLDLKSVRGKLAPPEATAK